MFSPDKTGAPGETRTPDPLLRRQGFHSLARVIHSIFSMFFVIHVLSNSPQLNGKVERSHRTDQEEFYQLLTYTDDVDLNKKLAEWKRFYNLDHPHGAFKRKTPYEALRCSLE